MNKDFGKLWYTWNVEKADSSSIEDAHAGASGKGFAGVCWNS